MSSPLPREVPINHTHIQVRGVVLNIQTLHIGSLAGTCKPGKKGMESSGTAATSSTPYPQGWTQLSCCLCHSSALSPLPIRKAPRLLPLLEVGVARLSSTTPHSSLGPFCCQQNLEQKHCYCCLATLTQQNLE